MRLLSTVAVAALLAFSQSCKALHLRGGRPSLLLKEDAEKRALLQDVVTWDNHSLFIHGERIMIFSGEFHPFRLPVPSLWLDVFQKVKALGLNTVSFYVDWAQLEGKPGHFKADGIFDYSAFFAAAKEAGIYLIARPGPYINAEASGGGFPGWLQRLKGHLRTSDADYLAATDNYMANIASIIAKAQITNGGPVILYQPENEYSGATDGFVFPDPKYMQYVEDQARKAGIVVPFVSNDAFPGGHNAPGTGEGEVDIYGHDGYPLGFDCAHPAVWPASALPTNWHATHLNQSPSTPYTIPEQRMPKLTSEQGGSFDPWGGLGFPQCEELLNHEQVRVFYKNNYAAGVTIYSLYMIFGGTNWGNLGHPGGYTSYDYAAAIAEDRTVAREKYSELKLEANFLKVSPGYLTASPGLSNLTGVYSSSQAVTVTPVIGTNGSFYVVRHTDYQLTSSTPYTMTLPTSRGSLAIPQLGGTLTLTRRDSKIHVTDYPVGDSRLIYSTAEIFTWQKFSDRTVLVVYGGPGETHEMAIDASSAAVKTAGSGVTIKEVGDTYLVAQWQTSTERRVVQIGDLHVYIVDRNSAYDYWVAELSGSSPSSLIVNGGYLLRSASVDGNTLNIKADFNSTTSLELIGVPSRVTSLCINDAQVEHTVNAAGNWVADAGYHSPRLPVPDLSALNWMYVDSLPEIQPGYDDSAWPDADHTTTNNTYVQPFRTPVSLYGSDYGFHPGALLFRGHFDATGAESQLYISTQGGSAFGSSAWLNGTFLGSWPGIDAASAHNDTYALPKLTKGRRYVLTVLVDNMGLDENWVVGVDQMKNARGILDYRLIMSSPSSSTGNATTAPTVRWKITGNLGGESYADPVRGPLNEGGLFIERQGLHQPEPLRGARFAAGTSPFEGITAPGVAFYAAKMPLNLPSDKWDIPLSFSFVNDTAGTSNDYRAWLYVNGYQFGRYVSNIGPQRDFPVPEGILNYQGDNWIGLAVWATQSAGAKVPGLSLVAKTPVLTGREKVDLVEAPAWTPRPGAY
ncbi:glycoside hydrolase [Diplogelasinospora grovesii]|uniref:Beta-galactosidase n=1 Tax=Diplogelasinospora grovesii TaxID=303347 RepID=A0AAN6MY78_9PEZI|nr:glycoside hydrolase [Diplogelasinospora grovesii]